MSFKKPDLFFIFRFLKSFSFSISSKKIVRAGVRAGEERRQEPLSQLAEQQRSMVSTSWTSAWSPCLPRQHSTAVNRLPFAPSCPVFLLLMLPYFTPPITVLRTPSQFNDSMLAIKTIRNVTAPIFSHAGEKPDDPQGWERFTLTDWLRV